MFSFLKPFFKKEPKLEFLNSEVGDSKKIYKTAKDYGCTKAQIAYILATAWHESWATMKPIRETKKDSDRRVIQTLDHAWANGQLPWVSTAYWRKDKDGKAWYGRGYVQITLKDNYVKASNKLGVDLVSNPDKVLDSKIALVILVRGMMEGWFTPEALPKYINNKIINFYNARKVVNGLDRASKIAKLAEEYYESLKGV